MLRPPVWVAELAARFWIAAGDPPPFPRDLAAPLAWLEHVRVVKLPRLTLASAVAFVSRMTNTPLLAPQQDRELRGFFQVHDGIAFILVAADDDPDQQRFTLAHEVAHFLRDYLEPRCKAVARLGPSILDVLDGRRPATPEERLAGVLRRVTVGPHTHLLERDRWGRAADESVRDAEDAADRLAFELLAPFDAVEARVRFLDREGLISRLTSDFGLPPVPAAEYARLLLPGHFPRKFIPQFAKN
jgi:Zn-dependent peptidase ImmA (M78 family)